MNNIFSFISTNQSFKNIIGFKYCQNIKLVLKNTYYILNDSISTDLKQYTTFKEIDPIDIYLPCLYSLQDYKVLENIVNHQKCFIILETKPEIVEPEKMILMESHDKIQPKEIVEKERWSWIKWNGKQIQQNEINAHFLKLINNLMYFKSIYIHIVEDNIFIYNILSNFINGFLYEFEPFKRYYTHMIVLYCFYPQYKIDVVFNESTKIIKKLNLQKYINVKFYLEMIEPDIRIPFVSSDEMKELRKFNKIAKYLLVKSQPWHEMRKLKRFNINLYNLYKSVQNDLFFYNSINFSNVLDLNEHLIEIITFLLTLRFWPNDKKLETLIENILLAYPDTNDFIYKHYQSIGHHLDDMKAFEEIQSIDRQIDSLVDDLETILKYKCTEREMFQLYEKYKFEFDKNSNCDVNETNLIDKMNEFLQHLKINQVATAKDNVEKNYDTSLIWALEYMDVDLNKSLKISNLTIKIIKELGEIIADN
jgi:hypothetical protein